MFYFFYSRFKLAREVMQSGTGGNTADFWDFPPKGRLRSASATEPSKGATKKFNLFTSSKQLPQGENDELYYYY